MKFFIVAGEASGDIHGANLVKELKKLYPDMELFGTGGENLKALGQKQYYTSSDMAIIGFVEIIKKLPLIFSLFKNLEKAVVETKPDCIILIDYPGFNLRFAKRIKKLGIPIVYFVAPQFWVWDYKRIFTLRDYCDLTLSIYPFEKESLDKEKVNSRYIGNPIIDNFKYKFDSNDEFLKATKLDGKRKIIGILPGSRIKEIGSLLKTFIEAAHHYQDKFDFVISRAESVPLDMFEEMCKDSGISFLSGAQYDIMKYADYIWACSGTVTLECALAKKPMIITYRASSFNIWLAKRLSKLRVAGLPNIIAGEKFIPEIVGPVITTQEIIKAFEYVIENEISIREKLSHISSLFEGYTPSFTAAAEISSLLKAHQSK